MRFCTSEFPVHAAEAVDRASSSNKCIGYEDVVWKKSWNARPWPNERPTSDVSLTGLLPELTGIWVTSEHALVPV
jgi:hypothetical protein